MGDSVAPVGFPGGWAEFVLTSENSVLDALGIIPVSESVLSEIVKKSVSEIKAELVVLELRGLVRKVDGGYVRA